MCGVTGGMTTLFCSGFGLYCGKIVFLCIMHMLMGRQKWIIIQCVYGISGAFFVSAQLINYSQSDNIN